MAFELKTAAFPPNGRIPDIYTCEGEDVPPPLAWSGAPAGTKSLALIVDDPDAPKGTFCHWAMFDISPTATGIGDEIPAGAHEAVNDFGRMGYGGPCPPPGHVHHYRFRMIALNVPRLNIPQRATCQDVQRAAGPHKLAEATLVGTYAR
jgi:Raf kinase inhibitor-like YbhB/YbcL family protein